MNFLNRITLKNMKWLKRIGIVIGGTLLFFSVLTVIESCVAPSKLVAQDIKVAKATVKSVGGKYVGPLYKEMYEGQGQFNYLKGGTYVGIFSASKRSGSGTFKWKNGDTYVGTWSGDNMDYGTYTFKDGRTYKGQFVNNKLFKGHIELGKMVAQYGFLSYAADIANGKVDAVLCEKSNGFKYNGKLTGYAEIKYPTGNTYVGNVVNGVRHGAGTFKWTYYGAYYTGQWANDDMNGIGTYFYKSAQYPYISGNFVNGKPNGKAIYYKNASNKFNTIWQNGRCVNNDA